MNDPREINRVLDRFNTNPGGLSPEERELLNAWFAADFANEDFPGAETGGEPELAGDMEHSLRGGFEPI